jgi:glycosyltransferase involved in cell wall biosynthesis
MEKRIVIIYINRFGDYPIVYEYGLQLVNFGYSVAYIGVSTEDEHFFSDNGIEVFHVCQQNGGRFSFAEKVCALLKRINPQLVHIFHYRWSFFVPIRSLFRYKLLLDVRTVHVADKKGNHSPLTFLKNRITWFESQFFAHVIALTTDIRKILLPSYKSIPVIPLGANLTTFRPPDRNELRSVQRKNLAFGESTRVFLYSGTLNPIRRIDIVLEAFGKMAAIHTEVFLIIAGDDKDNPETIETLKRLADNSGMADRVLFTGFIPYKQLIAYYLASEFGVCYIPQTPFYDLQPPTKLFEYLAAGLIVIATGTTAGREIIRDSENGYLSNDDADSLHAAMQRALEEYTVSSEQMKSAGYNTVKSYSWEKIIREYLVPVYRRILSD